MDLGVTRRELLLTGLAASAVPRAFQPLATPEPGVHAGRLVIDLATEPSTIIPGMAYTAGEWSVVHSIYDALVGYNADSQLVPYAAESFEADSDTSFLVTLRAGMRFHDGSPVTADAITAGFEHLRSNDSLVKETFAMVTDVDIIDDHTARIVCAEPSPWLPAQMAAWHVLLPDATVPDEPIGSGPFRFVAWDHGATISLERFTDWTPIPAKGSPLGDTVIWRFIGDEMTRLSDVLSFQANIATVLSRDTVEAGQQEGVTFVNRAVAGSAFIRIAQDLPPFDNADVRRTLNLALDVDAIAEALLPPGSQRLASFPPISGTIGWDDALAPYAYDPGQARQLLAAAGLTSGIDVTMELAPDASPAIAEAIVAQWGEVGLRVTLTTADYATFNASWTDPAAAPLRFVTWRPLIDPYTLVSLVFAGDGMLARQQDAALDSILAEAAVTTEPADRAARYVDAARRMHDDAAAVWLWNLADAHAVTAKAADWAPRSDAWILPLTR